MSCCCIRVLNLCKVPVCGTLEINQATESGASGLYTLLLDYLQTTITLTGEQAEGENISFDIRKLNESYEYTGQIFDSEGNKISITVDDVEYDCIKFRTIMQISAEPVEDEEPETPPVLDIPDTVVIEAVIGQEPVVTGTTEEVTGIEDGSNTITCDAFEGVRVIIIRGNVPIPGIDPLDGSYWFTKLLASNFITLNQPLVTGEFIRIQTIPQ